MADSHPRPKAWGGHLSPDKPLPKAPEPLPLPPLPPKPKQHGGKRAGAGRKPTPGKIPKVTYTVRVPPEIKAGLMRLGVGWLEQTVIEALRIEQERKS